ncbi:MAG: hypothetical protein ACFCU5_20930 [Pleurocapsa sp.]
MSLVCNDLATKAELQQLRNQINTLLGNGTDVLTAGTLANTPIGDKLELATTAIQDITVTGNDATWQSLSDGTSKLAKVNGEGTQSELTNLEDFSKLTGQSGGHSMMTASIVTVLAQHAGMIFLTLMGVYQSAKNIFDISDIHQRISEQEREIISWDYRFGEVIAVLDEHSESIEASQSAMGDVVTSIQTLKDNQSTLETNVSNLSTEVTNQKATIDSQQGEIDFLKMYAEQIRGDFENFQIDALEDIGNLQAVVDTILSNIDNMTNQMTDLKTQLEGFEIKIAYLQDLATFHYQRMLNVESRLLKTEGDLAILKGEVETQDEYIETQLTGVNAKLAKLGKRITTYLPSGSGAAAASGAADAQTKTLELAKTLAGSDEAIPTITREHIYNGSSTFTNLFDTLLSQIDLASGGLMNPEQQAEMEQNIASLISQLFPGLRNGIANDVNAGTSALLGASVLPVLGLISNQTSPSSIANGVESGICQSLNNPSGCPTSPGNPNPMNGLRGLREHLDSILGGINVGLNSAMLPLVQATHATVHHATWGLEQAHRFADTAWRATGGDKVLNAISTALTIHNAVMLSNNLARTVGETATITLEAMGIKDSEGDFIDVNSVIKNKMNQLLSSFLGAENYTALTQGLAKANRIYQTGANLMYLTRSLFDSARAINEVTAENTGMIGNALRQAGVVPENAYRTMMERVSPLNRSQRRFEAFRRGLESIDEVTSTVDEISSEVISIRETYIDLQETWEAWEAETGITIGETQAEIDDQKEKANTTAEPTDVDFAKKLDE